MTVYRSKEVFQSVQISYVDGVLPEELGTFLDTLPYGWNQPDDTVQAVLVESIRGAFPAKAGQWVVAGPDAFEHVRMIPDEEFVLCFEPVV